MSEMVTFLLNIHTCTHRAGVRGGEVRSTGWMVCHRGNGQLAAMEIMLDM